LDFLHARGPEGLRPRLVQSGRLDLLRPRVAGPVKTTPARPARQAANAFV